MTDFKVRRSSVLGTIMAALEFLAPEERAELDGRDVRARAFSLDLMWAAGIALDVHRPIPEA